eukprot:935336-Prorocentrum_minimum.AAC.1
MHSPPASQGKATAKCAKRFVYCSSRPCYNVPHVPPTTPLCASCTSMPRTFTDNCHLPKSLSVYPMPVSGRPCLGVLVYGLGDDATAGVTSLPQSQVLDPSVESSGRTVPTYNQHVARGWKHGASGFKLLTLVGCNGCRAGWGTWNVSPTVHSFRCFLILGFRGA